MLILTHNNYFFNVSNANKIVQPRGLFQLVPGESEHELTSQRVFATLHTLQLKAVYDVANGTRRPDHTTQIQSVSDRRNLEDSAGLIFHILKNLSATYWLSMK